MPDSGELNVPQREWDGARRVPGGFLENGDWIAAQHPVHVLQKAPKSEGQLHAYKKQETYRREVSRNSLLITYLAAGTFLAGCPGFDRAALISKRRIL